MKPIGDPRLSRKPKRYLVLPFPPTLPRGLKKFLWGTSIIVLSNLATHAWLNPDIWREEISEAVSTRLYLMDKAGMFVIDQDGFEAKVREISDMLNIPPEWLMAVMYSESKFDANVANYKGSGATGLIQFMPVTAKELNVSVQRLANMSHLQQLEYVYIYLQQVRERYGDYDSLTDLYLGILFPKARKQDYCYTLYAKPSKSYMQNSGLDENKDGRVTISDVDKRMQRLFPTAYGIGIQDNQ